MGVSATYEREVFSTLSPSSIPSINTLIFWSQNQLPRSMIMTDFRCLLFFSAVFYGSQENKGGQRTNQEGAPKGITTRTPRPSQKMTFSPFSLIATICIF